MNKSNDQISRLNEKPVAALNLGLCSRFPRLDFLKNLNHSLAVLVSEIPGNAYVGLQRSLHTIEQHVRKHEELEGRKDSSRSWNADKDDWSNLELLANSAVAPTSPDRIWYEIGAVLGDIAASSTFDNRSCLDTSTLQAAVRSLPETCLRNIKGLRELSDCECNRERLYEVLESVLNRKPTLIAIPQIPGSPPLPPLRTFPASLPELIVEYVDYIAGRLQEISIPNTAVRDIPTEARDKWIYDECCGRTPYKEIINELQRMIASGQQPEWESIESVNGIKRAAERYAARHDLPLPPKRASGRPKR